MEQAYYLKKHLAARYLVTEKTIENWGKRYKILMPAKLGGRSARWSAAQVDLIDLVLDGFISDDAAVAELTARKAARIATRPALQRRPGKTAVTV